MESKIELNTSLLNELKVSRQDEGAEPGRRGPALILCALVLLALGALALVLAPRLASQSAPLVRVATATGPAPAAHGLSVLDASGYVTARRLATVSFKTTGRIKEILMKEGQNVTAGQILATLDPVDANAALQLARAQLSSARSQFDSVTVQSLHADAELRRAEELESRQFVSRAQSEQTRAQRDLLKMQAITARMNVDVAERQVQIAMNGVEDTRLRAPFKATVVAQSAQVGEIVSPLSAAGGGIRTGVGTLVDMDSLEIEVDVNELYIGHINKGMPAQAVLDSYPDWRIPAQVIAITPHAQRSSGTMRVRLAIEAADPRLLPDMGVKVSFRERAPSARDSSATSGVRLPHAAIVQTGQGASVVLVDRIGRTERRAVTLGASFAGERQVTAGVQLGETVVLNPSADLGHGAMVRTESPPHAM